MARPTRSQRVVLGVGALWVVASLMIGDYVIRAVPPGASRHRSQVVRRPVAPVVCHTVQTNSSDAHRAVGERSDCFSGTGP
jgi:hypothetical protein